MTSESAEKSPPESLRSGRFVNTLMYANRRFHNNKLSCFLFTLVFVLVGCLVVMPPMLRESSQMLDRYRTSPSELLSRLREIVAAENGANLDDIERKLGIRKEVKTERKGKGGKNKGKKGEKGKKKDLNDEGDKDEENDGGEDYGDISTKINKKGKKKIRNNFKFKEKNGKRVWEEKIDANEEEEDDLKKGNQEGRNNKGKKRIYTQDVPFKLSENWTAADTEQERQLMRKRAARVEQVCEELQKQKNYTEFPKKRLMNNMRWVMDQEMVWCPIFKAASTTWVKNLLELANDSMESARFHSKTKELYPMPDDPNVYEPFLEKAMKLIIVRHPLDRILSAYRDKMLRTLPNGKEDNFKDIQRDIAQNFDDPKLPEGMDDANIRPESDDMPTFNQFLLRVKEDVDTYWSSKGKYRINLHWRPYWATCSPCTMEYDTIAKVETLPKDQEYVIRDRGIEDTILYAQSHSSNFDCFNSTKEATIAYFSHVPRSLLEDIVTSYQPDFALFDYSPDYHLSLAIKGI